MELGDRLRELPGPVLITGHTGFKGTWLSILLESINIPTIGYSLAPESDSLYKMTNRENSSTEIYGDIRDYKKLEKFIDSQMPSTVIHMAAQPLVLKSYEEPRETFEVNVNGTLNLLDIATKKNYIKAVIVVTTDKVYKNNNSEKDFVETDALQGKDPYSASKVAAESVVAAWQQISLNLLGPKVISVRAGNVIGGGDLAVDRIIPDLVRGYVHRSIVTLRNPESKRPWQHVLDPLAGYIMALENLLENESQNNLNFGPSGENLSVRSVVSAFTEYLPVDTCVSESNDLLGKSNLTEATYLSLDSSLSKSKVGWSPRWNQLAAIEKTGVWWRDFLVNGKNPLELCLRDITEYLDFRFPVSDINLKN